MFRRFLDFLIDEKYKNHSLINDRLYKDCMECHIEPDWLLMYQVKENILVLSLVRTGSHSELLNM